MRKRAKDGGLAKAINQTRRAPSCAERNEASYPSGAA